MQFFCLPSQGSLLILCSHFRFSSSQTLVRVDLASLVCDLVNFSVSVDMWCSEVYLFMNWYVFFKPEYEALSEIWILPWFSTRSCVDCPIYLFLSSRTKETRRLLVFDNCNVDLEPGLEGALLMTFCSLVYIFCNLVYTWSEKAPYWRGSEQVYVHIILGLAVRQSCFLYRDFDFHRDLWVTVWHGSYLFTHTG